MFCAPRNSNGCCCLLTFILFLPWNLLVSLFTIALILIIWAITIPVLMPLCIFNNCRHFYRIMSYWSSSNRFKGPKMKKQKQKSAKKSKK